MFLTIILAVLCLALLGMVAYLLTRKSAIDPTLLEWLKSSQQQASESNRHVSESISTQTKEINDRLTHAAEVIGELKREAGKFSELGQSMKDLDALLKSPKLRGNMGERVLADLIGQVFPKHQFFLQHRFKSGAIVDAAIQTDAGILPIDSKFPMEHFQAMLKGETQSEREMAKRDFTRDVKRHIDAIAQKYILPEEGTMDFALMYVPSESVFYEIAADDSILEYASHARVYPVSPTTFYAHLQTIMLSFEGKKIETKTKEAFKLLRGVQKDYEKFSDNFMTLGKHLTNAQNMFGTSAQSLGALERGLSNIRQLAQNSEDKTPELPV
ncbi:MAG: DNA recombination protein RmuC [Candidatus Woesebacteria bacterium]